MTLGWAVGDAVTGAGIPANTYIVSMTAAGVTLSQAATATRRGVAITVTSGTTRRAALRGREHQHQRPGALPPGVSQFNGRAWYAVRNGLQFTDSLSPWQITNATQALTLGDDTA
jgi:hypothetical protein